MKKHFALLAIIPLLTSCGSSASDYNAAKNYLEKANVKRVTKTTIIDNLGNEKEAEVLNFKSLPATCAYKLTINTNSSLFSENPTMNEYEIVINKNTNWIYSYAKEGDRVYKTYHEYNVFTRNVISSTYNVDQGIKSVYTYSGGRDRWFNEELSLGSNIHSQLSLRKYLLSDKLRDSLTHLDYETFKDGYEKMYFSVNGGSMYAKFEYTENMYKFDDGYMIVPPSMETHMVNNDSKQVKVKTEYKFSNYLCKEYKVYYEFDGKRCDIISFKKTAFHNEFRNEMKNYPQY